MLQSACDYTPALLIFVKQTIAARNAQRRNLLISSQYCKTNNYRYILYSSNMSVGHGEERERRRRDGERGGRERERVGGRGRKRGREGE